MNTYTADQLQPIIDILLMPIISTKSYHGISIFTDNASGNKFIISQQSYEGADDEDMSDFAIEFYNTIYSNKVSIDNGVLRDYEYAGDTMNSYNQIAHRINCSKSNELFNQYHCLANFWVLPLAIGRKLTGPYSKRQVSKDYMDGFLLNISECIDDYKKAFPNYFTPIKNINDFCKLHWIEDIYYTSNQREFKKITGYKNPDDGIDTMITLIKARAKKIAETNFDDLQKLSQQPPVQLVV